LIDSSALTLIEPISRVSGNALKAQTASHKPILYACIIHPGRRFLTSAMLASSLHDNDEIIAIGGAN